MKPRAKKAVPTPRERVPAPTTGQRLRQRWREAWDVMPLAGQLRLALLAAVTLTILVAQLLVATFEIAANYVESRNRAAEVAAAILQHEDGRGNRDVLGGVQSQPSVIAATLEQPAGEVLWTFDKGVPYVASPLFYRDVLYMVKDGGILTSLDPATGKPLKQARARGTGNYYASPVAGDGKLYVVSERGVISVVQAGGEWSILSSHDLAERTVATPVIVDGKILIRTEAAMYCFGR
jgi:hypothetical protein